jgi:hypothetical protein
MIEWHINESKSHLNKIKTFKVNKNYSEFFKFIHSELNPLHATPWLVIRQKLYINKSVRKVKEIFISGRVTFPEHYVLDSKVMELKQQVSDLASDLEEQILIEQMNQSFKVKHDVIYIERG